MERVCTVETFYRVLGVAQDAGKQTVVRAYRDEAKSHRPDVNGCPNATGTFERLTTAKAVFADASKRSRYADSSTNRLSGRTTIAVAGHTDGRNCFRYSAGTGPAELFNDLRPSVSAETRAKVEADTTTVSASKTACAYADGGSSTAEPRPKRDPNQGESDGTATAYYRPGERTNPGANHRLAVSARASRP